MAHLGIAVWLQVLLYCLWFTLRTVFTETSPAPLRTDLMRRSFVHFNAQCELWHECIYKPGLCMYFFQGEVEHPVPKMLTSFWCRTCSTEVCPCSILLGLSVLAHKFRVFSILASPHLGAAEWELSSEFCLLQNFNTHSFYSLIESLFWWQLWWQGEELSSGKHHQGIQLISCTIDSTVDSSCAIQDETLLSVCLFASQDTTVCLSPPDRTDGCAIMLTGEPWPAAMAAGGQLDINIQFIYSAATQLWGGCLSLF